MTGNGRTWTYTVLVGPSGSHAPLFGRSTDGTALPQTL